MAKRNYLVEGLSGAGKSSVYEELIRRGYRAVSTDRAWKVPGRSRLDRATWDQQKAVAELESRASDVLFVCGSSGNRERFLSYFTKVFTLRIDEDTMRRRLQERTNNDFGKEREELELMLRLNRSDELPAGAIAIDATQPLEHVVDEVLRLADCEIAASDSPPPWSKRGSVVGQARVFSSSGESVAEIEYSWSGNVLSALLLYLAEHGIDLMHSDHVLTSDDRERFVALLDPSAFDGQRFAATTSRSTRRRRTASATRCWTGSRSCVTRSSLLRRGLWPSSSSGSQDLCNVGRRCGMSPVAVSGDSP